MENQDRGADDLADRIAQRALAKRGATYASEVRRLLDAGLEVMRLAGPTGRPRVSDIVAASGLSNDAFYRHFPSKDALVAAILQDGADRLRSYLAHRMSKAPTPEAKVRAWVDGVLSQAADDEVARATMAVLWNAGTIGHPLPSGHGAISRPVAALLHEPLARMGVERPTQDASLVAHAVIGLLSDYLTEGLRPTKADIDHAARFCLAGAGHPTGRAPASRVSTKAVRRSRTA
jgi:AcrR family transcriptional regulator